MPVELYLSSRGVHVVSAAESHALEGAVELERRVEEAGQALLLVLAVVTAVNSASAGSSGSPEALLDGFHAAIIVSLVVAALGVAATVLRRRGGAAVPRPEPA
jgi:hypothetical protein